MEVEKSCDSIGLDALAQQTAALRDELHEIKEMLARLLNQNGCETVGASPRSRLFSGDESRIPLEDAVSTVCGKSAAKDPESLRIHTDFLKRWSTIGVNSVILETETVDDKWFTSREAVERFQRKLNL